MQSEDFSLTDRDRALWDGESIQAQMPIHFVNGMSLEQCITYCASCNQEITGDNFHGILDATYPKVVLLEGVGACVPCTTMTRYNFRIHDDLTITGLIDGKWQRWGSEPNWLKRLQRLLGRFRAGLSSGNNH